MTISEQLHFSILSAPVAAVDRRALSQAWYSALYRSGGRQSCAAPLPETTCAASAVPSRKGSQLVGSPPQSAPATRAARAEQLSKQGVAPGQRRARHLRLARQIEELVRRRESKRVAATFFLDGTRARVRVLILSDGGSVRLIAVCSKRVRDSVARALAQARYAAAARGIVLRASTREDTGC